MKKLVLLWILISLQVWGRNQINELDLPQNVSKNFRKQYPSAMNVVWEKVDNEYEASYTDNGKTFWVHFDETGAVTRLDKEIEATELPNIHVQKIRELYANDFRIMQVVLRDYTSRRATYWVTVKHSSLFYNFVFEPLPNNEHSMYIQRMSRNSSHQ